MRLTFRFALSLAMTALCLCAVYPAQAGVRSVAGGTSRLHHKKVFTVADEAERILKDVKEQGYEVTEHTGELTVASGLVTTSKHFNAAELEAVKEDVNAIGKEMSRLEGLAANESSWERETVSKLKPMLKDLASETDKAIAYTNNHPEKLHLAEYQGDLKHLYELSTSFWRTAHDSVRLADLGKKEKRLRTELQERSR